MQNDTRTIKNDVASGARLMLVLLGFMVQFLSLNAQAIPLFARQTG